MTDPHEHVVAETDARPVFMATAESLAGRAEHAILVTEYCTCRARRLWVKRRGEMGLLADWEQLVPGPFEETGKTA